MDNECSLPCSTVPGTTYTNWGIQFKVEIRRRASITQCCFIIKPKIDGFEGKMIRTISSHFTVYYSRNSFWAFPDVSYSYVISTQVIKSFPAGTILGRNWTSGSYKHKARIFDLPGRLLDTFILHCLTSTIHLQTGAHL